MKNLKMNEIELSEVKDVIDEVEVYEKEVIENDEELNEMVNDIGNEFGFEIEKVNKMYGFEENIILEIEGKYYLFVYNYRDGSYN